MAQQDQPEYFVIVRRGEVEKLKRLSANASKLLIAIRFGRKEDEPFAVGCRDFEDWGIKKTVAAEALKELVEAGLLKIVEETAFEYKRQRQAYRIVHTRDYERQQSAMADTQKAPSPVGRTVDGATVRPSGQNAVLQSGGADIPSKPSSPSSRKAKEGLGSACASASADGADADRGAREAEREHQKALEAQRDRSKRIFEAASAIGKRPYDFMKMAGGPKPADFFARKWKRGELTTEQLKSRLAESKAGLLNGSEQRCSDEPDGSERVDSTGHDDQVDVSEQGQQLTAEKTGSPPVNFTAFGSPRDEHGRWCSPAAAVAASYSLPAEDPGASPRTTTERAKRAAGGGA